ncbi:phage holin [Paenibacillus sp. Soil724D2]|uniref:phage holin n=1 Tax=Paenibacillus sp. (strain Soil724D2) TaxID=1736392 RepID=UPI00071268D6|nr:phage holin [Paenibacillus sp. Soil724D2]KRE33439.1 hypothetical protein ASG85_14325 [Paenibacillus sp. Soil724D2]
MMQKLIVRLQNKKVLLSLFAGVILILTNTGVIDVSASHQAEVIFNTVLSILVGLGVISDPESHVE